MIIYQGIIASEGIATGDVHVYNMENILNNILNECKTSDPIMESRKLTDALNKYRNYLSNLKNILQPNDQELIEAYRLMAESLVSEANELILRNNICAELAIKLIYEKYSKLFKESGNELIALRESDLRSIASNIIDYILEINKSENKTALIIVADEIYPIDAIKLISQNIKGIVTRRGGVTSHTAIIARNNNIPYLIVPDLEIERMNELEGKYVIIDALEGKLIINPNEETLKVYDEISKRYESLRETAKNYAHIKSRTINGREISVLCNVSNIEEARVASTLGCDGIGLFRTEFLYLSNNPPNQELLYNIFIKLLEFFGDKQIVIRAPDLGADKPIPYIKLEENNPFLGLRGVRLLLELEYIFKPFLKAYLSVAKSNNNLRLLIPMVSKVREIYEVAELIEKVGAELGLSHTLDIINLGIMVETPAAVILLDKIIETGYVKFISIGTNDLTQYTLAVDRTNIKVSSLYSEFDPSVLRLIKIAIEKAKHYNLHTEVCGEMTSRQYATPILIGMGVDALSVNPPLVGLIKYTISKLDEDSIRKELISKVLELEDENKVIQLVRDYLREKGVIII